MTKNAEDENLADRELLAQLHSELVKRARDLLDQGDHSLAMQLIKHNGITAPQVSEKGTMQNASAVAAKLQFLPRERVVPLRADIPRVSPE